MTLAWKATLDTTEGAEQMQDTQVGEILIEDDNSDEEEDNVPQVKIPPTTFKGLPKE